METKDVVIGKKYRLIKGGIAGLSGFSDGVIVKVVDGSTGSGRFKVYMMGRGIPGFAYPGNLEELTDILKPKNGFTFENWEVSFLQEKPLTVCVIRNLKKIDQRFVGLAVCNPKDKWSNAGGRHKALKDVLESKQSQLIQHTWYRQYAPAIIRGHMHVFPNILPVKAIQKAYWEYYKEEEK